MAMLAMSVRTSSPTTSLNKRRAGAADLDDAERALTRHAAVSSATPVGLPSRDITPLSAMVIPNDSLSTFSRVVTLSSDITSNDDDNNTDSTTSHHRDNNFRSDTGSVASPARIHLQHAASTPIPINNAALLSLHRDSTSSPSSAAAAAAAAATTITMHVHAGEKRSAATASDDFALSTSPVEADSPTARSSLAFLHRVLSPSHPATVSTSHDSVGVNGVVQPLHPSCVNGSHNGTGLFPQHRSSSAAAAAAAVAAAESTHHRAKRKRDASHGDAFDRLFFRGDSAIPPFGELPGAELPFVLSAFQRAAGTVLSDLPEHCTVRLHNGHVATLLMAKQLPVPMPNAESSPALSPSSSSSSSASSSSACSSSTPARPTAAVSMFDVPEQRHPQQLTACGDTLFLCRLFLRPSEVTLSVTTAEKSLSPNELYDSDCYQLATSGDIATTVQVHDYDALRRLSLHFAPDTYFCKFRYKRGGSLALKTTAAQQNSPPRSVSPQATAAAAASFTLTPSGLSLMPVLPMFGGVSAVPTGLVTSSSTLCTLTPSSSSSSSSFGAAAGVTASPFGSSVFHAQSLGFAHIPTCGTTVSNDPAPAPSAAPGGGDTLMRSDSMLSD